MNAREYSRIEQTAHFARMIKAEWHRAGAELHATNLGYAIPR